MELNYFEKFMKKSPEEEEQNNVVWTYTRVSSKDQEANKSLRYQKDYAIKYASENNLEITECFGETYESAKGDFTRKEFTKLINRVRKAKKRPLAIMIYKMNRFSRSGGQGIALATELVHSCGVHLIETSSGISTESQEGEYQIWQKLLRARKENMERLEHTLPGLKRFVEEGNYLGRPPLGYNLYGTRVQDFSLRATEQRIEINEKGKLLKKAWKMKANGEKDYLIRENLKRHGLIISKQKMSAMWRNSTYCGISTNSFLDNPIRGNWPQIVSLKNFKKVQELLESNKKGYQVETKHIKRPLTGHLFCPKCGNKLTSYEVKKKALHYYCCQKCKGVSINANTTKKAKKIGVHEMFLELLDSYQLDNQLLEPFKAQLKLSYKSMHQEDYEVEQAIKKRLNEVNSKLENLTEKLIEGVIDNGTYGKHKSKLEKELSELNTEINIDDKKISNLDNFINSILEFSQNVSNHWCSGDYETKVKIQELVFPEGLVLYPEKRQYLTKKVNRLFELISSISRDTREEEKKKASKNAGLSSLVAGTGLEPVTFGL
ncbi:recombinase family protein [Flavobacteriaceae bacterium MHTCC 0001]